MKIISLFSGAGGLDLGLIQAGNTVIWANDIDKDAVATYRENIGDHIVCDDIKNTIIGRYPLKKLSNYCILKAYLLLIGVFLWQI